MRNRRKRTRAEWTKTVEEWKSSGVSQKVFAARNDIAVTTLSWWSARLRREARAAGLPRLDVVPVEIVDDATEPTATFRVELPHDRAVIVPAAFDAASLRRLVAALEPPAC